MHGFLCNPVPTNDQLSCHQLSFLQGGATISN